MNFFNFYNINPNFIVYNSNLRQTSIINSLLITNCCFNYLNDYSYGGAIYFNNNNFKILIEYSIFLNCNSNIDGGSIYIYSTSNTDSILNFVIGYNSSSGISNDWNKGGQFSFIYTINKNEYYFTSISKCASNSLSRRSSIYIGNGFQKINNFNNSNNIMFRHSSFAFFYSKSLNCNFSTISNNFVSNNLCIIFIQISIISSNYYINFINNTNSISYSQIYSEDSSEVNYLFSIFSKNNDILFSILRSNNIRISNCWIDHLFSIGNYISISNSLTFTSTYNINHFNKFNCLILNSKKLKLNFQEFIFNFQFFLI